MTKTKSTRKFQMAIVAIVAVFNMCSAAWATSYHVGVENGDDANSGTLDSPLKTISAAVNKSVAGDTIWILTGTYRETINILRSGSDKGHSILIRAMPGSDVKIKGSDLIAGWVIHSGSIWKKKGWGINSQQVFVDDLPLQQIGKTCPFHSRFYGGRALLPSAGEGLADMKPGTFWYDQTATTLYVWPSDSSNPNKHQVEASVRNWIIVSSSNFIELHDLKFYHSNLTSQGLTMGIVNIFGKSWTVSNCTFTYGDFCGIHVTGEDHRIINSTFNNNGILGISINGSDAAHDWKPYDRPPQNILLDDNETSYNNYRLFNKYWSGGGLKAIPSIKGITVLKHKASHNNGAGIWFDGLCKNITIDRCIVTDNTGNGIFYEISDQASITSNLVIRNLHGIYISASDDVAVLNNTVVNNWAGIVFHGMPRIEHPSLRNNKANNNIVSESHWVDLVIYTNLHTASGNTSDNNLFFRPDGTVKISWTNHSGYDVNFTSIEAFASAKGQDIHSLNDNPQWKSPESDNYELKDSSPAIDTGTSKITGVCDKDVRGLPRIVDGDGDGIPTIDLGAFEFQVDN